MATCKRLEYNIERIWYGGASLLFLPIKVALMLVFKWQ